LRNSATTGVGDIVFVYGDPSDTTLMGDWNGDGTDTPGVVRNGVWHLRNSNTTGFGEISLAYGDPGDTPVVGDWDGNGTDTPGGVEGPGAFEQDGFATATCVFTTTTAPRITPASRASRTALRERASSPGIER